MIHFDKKQLLNTALWLIFTLFLCLPIHVEAQQKLKVHRCGNDLYRQALEVKHPGYIEREKRAFEMAEQSVLPRSGEVYRIPVVFHVIYNTNRQNIDDSLINNQIKVLNDAFRNRHADTANTRNIFKPLAGDAEIEFFLAEIDPDGNPTTGITRTKTDIETFGDISIILGTFNLEDFERMKFTEKGGQDAWPTNKYLNIWVADAGISFLGVYFPALLGLATPPRYPSLPDNWPEGSVDGIVDGVFLQYQTIGNNNPFKEDLQGLVSAGRTAVHEIGHYFGLRHIDGDEECGTDGIDDTPTMNLSSQEAGTCPDASINTCNTSEPNDLPDMWENYMDYSNDICQSLFTNGQVSHMRKVLTSQRDTLYNWKLGTIDRAINQMAIYPNPAQNTIHLHHVATNGVLTVYNAMGQVVKRIESVSSSTIDVANLNPGFYLMVYEVESKLLQARFVIHRP